MDLIEIEKSDKSEVFEQNGIFFKFPEKSRNLVKFQQNHISTNSFEKSIKNHVSSDQTPVETNGKLYRTRNLRDLRKTFNNEQDLIIIEEESMFYENYANKPLLDFLEEFMKYDKIKVFSYANRKHSVDELVIFLII